MFKDSASSVVGGECAKHGGICLPEPLPGDMEVAAAEMFLVIDG